MEHPRIYGQSNLRTFRDGWRVLKTIVKERYRNVEPVPQIHPLPGSFGMNEHTLPCEKPVDAIN